MQIVNRFHLWKERTLSRLLGMLECSSESVFLVDVEVDSMRGAIDGKVGTSIMTSPCRAEIKKAQEEIRCSFNFPCALRSHSDACYYLCGAEFLNFC